MNGTLSTAWRGMGWWKWLCLALLAIWLLFLTFRNSALAPWIDQGLRSEADLQVSLETRGALLPGSDISVQLSTAAPLDGAMLGFRSDDLVPVVWTKSEEKHQGAASLVVPDPGENGYTLFLRTRSGDFLVWELGHSRPAPAAQ